MSTSFRTSSFFKLLLILLPNLVHVFVNKHMNLSTKRSRCIFSDLRFPFFFGLTLTVYYVVMRETNRWMFRFFRGNKIIKCILAMCPAVPLNEGAMFNARWHNILKWYLTFHYFIIVVYLLSSGQIDLKKPPNNLSFIVLAIGCFAIWCFKFWHRALNLNDFKFYVWCLLYRWTIIIGAHYL